PSPLSRAVSRGLRKGILPGWLLDRDCGDFRVEDSLDRLLTLALAEILDQLVGEVGLMGPPVEHDLLVVPGGVTAESGGEVGTIGCDLRCLVAEPSGPPLMEVDESSGLVPDSRLASGDGGDRSECGSQADRPDADRHGRPRGDGDDRL